MQTTLLIDGDIFAYNLASAGQKSINWGEGVISTTVEPIEEVTPRLEATMDSLMERLKADDLVICLSVPSAEGWRKKVLPSYKSNRDGVAKPELLPSIKDWLREKYNVMERQTLEADDVMGILSTSKKLMADRRKIIVSIDKDMKTIPGWLFNPDKDSKPRLISEQEADYWHLFQTLTGDATDGYKGCPGIGPKKAEAVLFGVSPPWGHPEEQWPAVVAAFEAKGLTEEDALVQARVARICRATDYDFKRKGVKLWTPPK